MFSTVYAAAHSIVHAADEVPQDASKEQVLPALKFTANQLGEITENSGVYTPGTIATATRLILKPRETPQTISVIT
ncbi:MAG: TonB-dependent siderophore receptor, partial [Acinetobacter sp.]